MADISVCKHDACNCPITAEGQFCSDHCKEAAAQDISEIKCDCGHESCG